MLTFIDESGYPHPTDSTKNPILLGVCVHENDIKPITNQIYKLKDSIYGKQDEIKSTKLIREATITKNRTNNKAYVEGMVDIIMMQRFLPSLWTDRMSLSSFLNTIFQSNTICY